MMDEAHKIETETVDAVEAPARARVTPQEGLQARVTSAFERKRDYLTGFLAEEKPPVETGGAGGPLQEAVIEALKTIYDPEIPVNIYELGLIYDVAASEDGDVIIDMTLTTPHCPVAESMPGEVELRVLAVPGVRDAEVKLVWEPAWDPSKMTDEARLELGML